MTAASPLTPSPSTPGAAPPFDLAPWEQRLSPRNFERVAKFVQSYSGIKMPPAKHLMLEGRLRRRLRVSGFPNMDAYCDYLFDQGGLESELEQLMDAVTTNKTDFFREPAHFDFLREVILPEAAADGRHRLKFWSAACSTGAEAYTIAMVVEEFGGARRAFDYTLVGTDLSTETLAAARRGIYPAEMLDPVPEQLRTRYFLRSRTPGCNEVRVLPRLRSRLHCGRMNLMDEDYPLDADFDVIFCRNVLIYFDKPTQRQVVRRLWSKLRPGGYFMLGHSESMGGDEFESKKVTGTIFRK